VREYAKISSQFWNGKTGRQIREVTLANPEEGLFLRTLAFYLVSCPHANMIGVYHLPLSYVCADLGLPVLAEELVRVKKGLASLQGMGFCIYNLETETVFVVSMARYQIGLTLKPEDKRVTWVKRQVVAIGDKKLAKAFLQVYGEYYNIEGVGDEPSPFEAPSVDLQTCLEAPSKPGAGARAEAGAGLSTPRKSAPKPPEQPKKASGNPFGDQLIEDWKRVEGIDLPPSWADNKGAWVQVARLRKKYSDDEVLRRWGIFLADAADFFRGHDLLKFCAQFDRFKENGRMPGQRRHQTEHTYHYQTDEDYKRMLGEDKENDDA